MREEGQRQRVAALTRREIERMQTDAAQDEDATPAPITQAPPAPTFAAGQSQDAQPAAFQVHPATGRRRVQTMQQQQRMNRQAKRRRTVTQMNPYFTYVSQGGLDIYGSGSVTSLAGHGCTC